MISPSSLTPSSALGVTFCSVDVSFLTSSPGLGSVDDAVVVVDDVSVFGAGVVVEAFLGVLPPLCGGLAPPLAG